ncbi:MAG: hypothetical protein FWC75_08885 [Oscillospiraceae bacterium]|nr:hypothetical protein [Oscillospiraceae bacterium]
MKSKSNVRWVIRIVLISIAASMIFTLASTEVLAWAGYITSFAVLAVFIIIGIIFDIIGVAVTAATEAPFHSMAVHRECGAQESLKLIRNADRVASFCNDVVGDVTGIVSGTTAGLIAARLMESFATENLLLPLLISGAVTGLTVGGKAVGKNSAIKNSTKIMLQVGKLIHKVGRLISFLKRKPKSR